MKLVVMCHNIRSRENVGSIFRSADAFGISKIYLTGYTPAPPHPKISKTALGAENTVSWEKVFSPARLITRLKKEGYVIAALEQARHSRDISRSLYVKKGPLALLLGNEVLGVPKTLLKRCGSILEIPMRGKKESLNVAVAFGIAVYELTRR